MKFMSTLFVCFPRYLFREKVSWLIDCARIKWHLWFWHVDRK